MGGSTQAIEYGDARQGALHMKHYLQKQINAMV
jgi:hypothetical protein